MASLAGYATVRFIRVPREVVVKYERQRTRAELSRAVYESRRIGRNHHNMPNERKARDRKFASKPFIMWDGEGPKDAGYALFGNSLGNEICRPFLDTTECLELLLSCAVDNPNAIHIYFGGNYDVSMILWQLPHRALRMLKETTHTVWKGYRFEHIPGKWFTVNYGEITIKIYDVRPFFSGDYISAIEEFGIGTPEERETIRKGKANRAEFYWRDIDEIRAYFRTELRLGPPLMNALRDVFAELNYVPRSWHGPGALARMALKRHKVYDAMAKCPPEVNKAALFAFIAGRFEPFIAGHVRGRVYNADLHSAYPYFATQLPNLNKGSWRRTRNYEGRAKFAIYHIRYHAEPNSERVFPLFRRLSNGSIVWTHDVEGWYWTPEADLVNDDPAAEFVEGWVFDEENENDRPLAWLCDYYNKRRELKDDGNPAEYTLKLIINSVYGQFAQRAGWDRKTNSAPRSHQIEWAGYITSGCRAAVYRAAIACGEKLVSIDTDGIFSLAPITDIDTGPDLGQWDTTEYVDGIFWQSGLYCVATEEGWKKARVKSRGIAKGSYTADDLLEALHRDNCNINNCPTKDKHIHLTRRMFITYGLADIYGWELHNKWIDEPHEYVMGGNKRTHFRRSCAHDCNPPMHRLFQWSPMFGVMPDTDPWTMKHKLPWLEVAAPFENVMKDIELFNADHLADEDQWILGE